MAAARIAALQADIVQAVVGNVTDVMDGEWGDRSWVHLFVDFELAPDGVRSSAIAFALAQRLGEPLEKVAFRLPAAAKQLLAELAEAMAAVDGARWSSVQLRVEQDGRFGFDFAHEPPHRMGGQVNDTRFADYLERWQAGQDEQPRLDKSETPPAQRRKGLRGLFGGR